MEVSKEVRLRDFPDVITADCPARNIMEHVVSRWGVLVLLALLDGTMRFSALRRLIGGVSEKMLAQTLQTLERDGLVLREAKPVIPPHVEYSLTPLGEQAARLVRPLAVWANDHVPEVHAARAGYDEARA
ncbi:helix-turn-helix domain-containing protein [Streptomyces sp. WMMC500]|uniref:winged helix-turn-helix transcriptional regulator n=1 Tax=Streptomyces sp. WMMC500 TaxID=3015154 RepID=UPI00248B5433|nr:helix-turn-helix domain-containing protein [Streptomyces sp. WMMC500]WBB63845.1 helix-turn-helix domain-containing protein [Streptomyces sp. WMMC500]